MRLHEIEQVSAEAKRLKALKANADREKKRAKDVKAQADLSAELLKAQKARRHNDVMQKAKVFAPSVRFNL
ncbi:MAG TPA: hypothetical protein VIF82_10635 [Burkholderiaceae bacterium]|jgi:hypothetical protein